VDLNQGLVDLVAVALVAALAPIVVAVLPGPRIPQVVIFLAGGVLIGSGVLSVLVYPQIAVGLHRSAPSPADAGITADSSGSGTGAATGTQAATGTSAPPDNPGQHP
jgi:hypothetical protein